MLLDIPFPSIRLSHTPTPLELMPNLSELMDGPELWVKRDDCTGLAMGGNKARQLEYFLGQAKEQGADTLVASGAVHSNQVRMTIAAARKTGMKVEVQLEHRVPDQPSHYFESGNPLLNEVMGAKVHYLPEGISEEEISCSLFEIADELRLKGASPYIIPHSGEYPYGALGYVKAADEIIQQIKTMSLSFDAIVVASGSASTHAGLLFGFRLLGSPIKVYGICVRYDAQRQRQSVLDKTNLLAKMFSVQPCVNDTDIVLDDSALKPGYGLIGEHVKEAVRITAESEGILLDPAYTGKSMAGLLSYIRQDEWLKNQRVMFIHTGGTPGLFAYPQVVS